MQWAMLYCFVSAWMPCTTLTQLAADAIGTCTAFLQKQRQRLICDANTDLNIELVFWPLRDRREVVGGQQVHVRQPRFPQLPQMPARGARVGVRRRRHIGQQDLLRQQKLKHSGM